MIRSITEETGAKIDIEDDGTILIATADGEAAQPLGRMGTAQEVARLCLFLAAEATFTTGADHFVTGAAELGYGRKVRA